MKDGGDPQLPDETVDSSGWDAIVELTGGVPPDQIDPLRGIRELEAVFPLLHSLVGRSPRDFFVRAAVIEALVAAERPSFSPRDLEEILYWLDNSPRDSVLRGLRQAGWLDHDPALGTTITDFGRWVYDILSFLHRRLREGELLPTLAGLEYALDVGVDPIRHLLSLRSRLVALRQEMEVARASHSEVVLRRAVIKLQEALNLSAQIRAVHDRIPIGNLSARRVLREIHDLLSRLHGVGADLQAAITQVGRQYIQLTAGLTLEQIVRTLMGRPLQELAALGREALMPGFVPPPLLTSDVVAFAAEEYVARDKLKAKQLEWEEPAQLERQEGAAEVPSEARALIADLMEVAASNNPVTFRQVIPRNDPGESFLRASLLPLVGVGYAGEGAAGRLGALPLRVESEGDGWPEPLEKAPLSRLTRGTISPGGS